MGDLRGSLELGSRSLGRLLWLRLVNSAGFAEGLLASVVWRLGGRPWALCGGRGRRVDGDVEGVDEGVGGVEGRHRDFLVVVFRDWRKFR